MKREEMSKILHQILDQAAAVQKSVVVEPSIRVLAGTVTLLVLIIDEQSKRLDALEYCKASTAPGMSHQWIDLGVRVTCQYCGVERA